MHCDDIGSSKAVVVRMARPRQSVSLSTIYGLHPFAYRSSSAPMFPLSETRHTPGLSPPTPPDHFSPTEGNYISSFSHPSAPPPLTTLPARQLSDNSSQILVTPEEIAVQQQMAGRIVPPLEEPLVVDPNLAKNGTLSSSHDSEGYFEGVVGLKQDGTALIDHNLASSPYARYPSSPSANLHHHPYRRPPTLASPHKGNGQNSSPTIHYNPSHRSFSPSNLAPDGKPIFAMPFALQTNGGYALQQQAGLLAPPLEQSVKMDKQASSDSDQTTWQRWLVIQILIRSLHPLTRTVGIARLSRSHHHLVRITISIRLAPLRCKRMSIRTICVRYSFFTVNSFGLTRQSASFFTISSLYLLSLPVFLVSRIPFCFDPRD